MNMHSNYDNMPNNGMYYTLKCLNNHLNSSINFMYQFTNLLLNCYYSE